MKFLLVTLLLVAGISADEDISEEWEGIKAISRSNLDFTNALYQIMSHTEGNLFFSPSSIHTILSLTSQGARGVTAEQMVTGLHLPTDQQVLRHGFRALSTAIQTQSNIKLKEANRVFTDEAFPPVPEFKQTATEDFHSDTQSVNFATAHEEARKIINDWVEEQTEHKIKELLLQGNVKPSTSVVLVNAIYFKGSWQHEFQPNKTVSKPFYVSPDVTKDVQMMHINEDSFGHRSSEVLNADVLEIPYVGGKVSMVIILPKERFGLADVESRLAGLKFSNISEHIRVRKADVKLSLPKFKMTVRTEMKSILEKMGMTTMFSDTADFSGLVPVATKISDVYHKAFIEVNEEGTEASAATAVVGVIRSGKGLPHVTINVDHPFIFMLVNAETHENHKERQILFMGRYVNPEDE